MLAASWCACHKREKDSVGSCSSQGSLGLFTILRRHSWISLQELHNPQLSAGFCWWYFPHAEYEIGRWDGCSLCESSAAWHVEWIQVVGGSHAVGIEDMMWLVGHPGLIHEAIVVKLGRVQTLSLKLQGFIPERPCFFAGCFDGSIASWCTCSSVARRTCRPESTCLWLRVSSVHDVHVYRMGVLLKGSQWFGACFCFPSQVCHFLWFLQWRRFVQCLCAVSWFGTFLISLTGESRDKRVTWPG